MTRKLYFAYGSNLNLAQMKHRCPAAKVVGRKNLRGWKLVFRGVLDVIEDPRCTVHGGLFWITDKCEAALDRYEGFPSLYGKREFEIDGNPGIFYTMNPAHPSRYDIAPPSDYYYEACLEGFRDFGIDPQRLRRARAHAVKTEAERLESSISLACSGRLASAE